jgi:hypothetical protein
MTRKERPPGKACKGECRGARRRATHYQFLWMPLAGICELVPSRTKRKPEGLAAGKPTAAPNMYYNAAAPLRYS